MKQETKTSYVIAEGGIGGNGGQIDLRPRIYITPDGKVLDHEPVFDEYERNGWTGALCGPSPDGKFIICNLR